MENKIKYYLESVLYGDAEDLLLDIVRRELEKEFELENMTDFLFFNDEITDSEKIEILLEDIFHTKKDVKSVIERIDAKIEVAQLIEPHIVDRYFIEDVWLGIEEEEIQMTENALQFIFSDELRWFYTNFMSLKISGIEIYGFGVFEMNDSAVIHPIEKLNKGRRYREKLLFAKVDGSEYWIDEEGSIYSLYNHVFIKVSCSLFSFLKQLF